MEIYSKNTESKYFFPGIYIILKSKLWRIEWDIRNQVFLILWLSEDPHIGYSIWRILYSIQRYYRPYTLKKVFYKTKKGSFPGHKLVTFFGFVEKMFRIKNGFVSNHFSKIAITVPHKRFRITSFYWTTNMVPYI